MASAAVVTTMRGRCSGDESEDAGGTARTARERQDTDNDPGTQRWKLGKVHETLEVPDAPRVADLAMDHEVRVRAGVDTEGVDPQPDRSALVDEEAGGLRDQTRGNVASLVRWRSARRPC